MYSDTAGVSGYAVIDPADPALDGSDSGGFQLIGLGDGGGGGGGRYGSESGRGGAGAFGFSASGMTLGLFVADT